MFSEEDRTPFGIKNEISSGRKGCRRWTVIESVRSSVSSKPKEIAVRGILHHSCVGANSGISRNGGGAREKGIPCPVNSQGHAHVANGVCVAKTARPLGASV